MSDVHNQAIGIKDKHWLIGLLNNHERDAAICFDFS